MTTTPDQLPPHDDQAEAGALACALISPNGEGAALLDQLDGSDFYDIRHSPKRRSVSAPDNPALQRALEYAARGWAVFPLVPGTKKPFPRTHGFKDAVTEETTIRQWWAEEPGADIGIATGTTSGFFVVDVDLYKDKHALDAFEQQHGGLPTTYTIKTARNGRHFYFQMPQGKPIRNSEGRLADYIDVRGDGGYIVAPPSTFEGGAYQVLRAEPPAPAPDWLIELVTSPTAADSTEDFPIGGVTIGDSAIGGVTIGDSAIGGVCNGSPLYNCLEVVASGETASLPSVITDSQKAKILQAVEAGAKSTLRNNAASFNACLALIRLRNVEDLSGMGIAERRYFAERWYEHLRAQGRTNPTKSKSHYLNDILNSVKNAKRYMQTKNPLPEAWMLAQSKPLPSEALAFDGDITMQRLVALAYWTHVVVEKGEFFLPRDKVGELMGLKGTDVRNLSDNFNVLVQYGVLRVVKAHSKAERKATTYRYMESGATNQPEP